MHNLPERDFDAARPFSRLGTDVTEFKVAGSKAYLAPVYDMASKEIVAWDVSRSPDLGQQRRLPAMLAERLPAGTEPILHSDMGWQYQHQWWRKELERPGIRRSMSRKGNCLDNAAAEQVFGHLKDEFYRGRNRRGLHIDGCIQFVAKESSDACSIIEFVGTRFTMPFMLHDEASGADQRTQTENRTKNRSQRRNEHGSDNADDAGHQQYPEHQF